MGRLIDGLHILPGKYHRVDDNDVIYTSLNGQYHTNGQMEVLTVIAGCQVVWIPYTADNVIPTRAVAGGLLASGSGSLLYVIRGPVGDSMMIGYYDPSTKIGYVNFQGVKVFTEMEMLVEG